MLANVAKRLAKHSNLVFYSFPNDLWKKGIKFDYLTSDVKKIFDNKGYCFAGFKGLIDPVRLPSSASGRTIFLVRDPRDMLTSQYFSVAISHPPPGSSLRPDRKDAFEARRAQVRDMQIDEYVLRMSSNVLRTYETTLQKLNSVNHKIYRYEDVVFDKIDWLKDIATYLSMEIKAETIEGIVRSIDVVPNQENAASHIRKVTPGDHKEKLLPATIDALNMKFINIFKLLGYQ